MSARFLALLSLIFAANANAASCDFGNLHFGISQEKLKTEFKIDELDVAKEGEAILRTHADIICKDSVDLPAEAIIEFILLDDKFVQLHIVNKNTDTALLAYATKIFGERDNKETDPIKMHSNEKVKTGLWGKTKKYSIIYTTNIIGKNEFENLTISSNGHKDLFTKINKSKNDRDDYLKEKKLGKYNPNYDPKTETEEFMKRKALRSRDRAN